MPDTETKLPEAIEKSIELSQRGGGVTPTAVDELRAAITAEIERLQKEIDTAKHNAKEGGYSTAEDLGGIVYQHIVLIEGLKGEIERLTVYKAACDEWHEKTNWVQESDMGLVGQHRADILREEIKRLKKGLSMTEEKLRMANATLKEADDIVDRLTRERDEAIAAIASDGADAVLALQIEESAKKRTEADAAALRILLNDIYQYFYGPVKDSTECRRLVDSISEIVGSPHPGRDLLEAKRQRDRLVEVCKLAHTYLDRTARPVDRVGAKGQIIKELAAALREIEGESE